MKISQANINGKEEGNQNEKSNIYELTRGKKKSTARKTETMEEEKGTEKRKGRKMPEDEV